MEKKATSSKKTFKLHVFGGGAEIALLSTVFSS